MPPDAAGVMGEPRPHDAVRVHPLLKALTAWVRLPILKGPLRGKLWLLHSHGKLARVLNAEYEPDQTALFERVLRPGDAVFDVGAHVGYYTLLASVLVGPAGRVFAFEPDGENLRDLKKHARINRCRNVSVIEAAAGKVTGSALFQPGPGSGRGQLAAEGTVEVPIVRLDEFARERGVVPHLIKIDVEGAELAVLRGARTLLVEEGPGLVLSTHGEGRRQKCLEFLHRMGYRCESIGENASELYCFK